MVICLFHHYNFVTVTYGSLFVFIGMPPNASSTFEKDQEQFLVLHPISVLALKLNLTGWNMMLSEYMRTQEQKHPLFTLWC